MKYYYYLLLALLCTVAPACKKGSTDAANTTKSATDYLTQKGWILSTERTNTDNGTWTDVYGSYKICQRDNVITFSPNGTYVTTEGASKCSVSDPQIIQQGTWAFTNSGTHLSISQPVGNAADVLIEQLDENTLKMLQETIVSSHDYKDEATYGHP